MSGMKWRNVHNDNSFKSIDKFVRLSIYESNKFSRLKKVQRAFFFF